MGAIGKTTKVLAPIEELTREVSSSSASVADVIRNITVFKRALTRENEADEGIKTMKATLLEAVNRRFRDVESEPLYSIAKLLDPRYKDRYAESLLTIFNMMIVCVCVFTSAHLRITLYCTNISYQALIFRRVKGRLILNVTCVLLFIQVLHKCRCIKTCKGCIHGRGKEDGRSAEEDHIRGLRASR